MHTTNNRAYQASLHFAQIQPDGWISDTLEALYEIVPIKTVEV